MRRYKKRPYKIKPYKSYRRKSNKKKFFLLTIITVLVSAVLVIWVLPSRESISFNFKVEDELPPPSFLSSYKPTPELDYVLHKRAPKVKGIYVTGNRAGSDGMDELIDLCKRTEINAMIIDVNSDDGYLTFAMNDPLIGEYGIIPNSTPIQDIGALIEKLYRNDIYPIARIIAFKNNAIKESHPDYMLKNKDGTFYESNEPGGQRATWLNPYNKDVWEYILTISKGAAAVGFKEIQFDYIRFHEGTYLDQVDFGPDSEIKGKTQIISEFTEYIVDQLHKEEVYVSADVFGAIITSEIDAQTVGQDYVEMARHLDYICPMVYPSHYANGSFGVDHPDLDPYQIILSSMEASSDQLKSISKEEHQAIVRPWLQDFTAAWMPVYQPYEAKQLRDQIQGVYDAGLSEWILWNASNRYTEDGLLAR